MKLPPFAKQLLSERNAGRHPERIIVLFGDDWRQRPPSSICVKPVDYSPGVFDWSICAGVPVHVVEQSRVEVAERAAFRLASEIAEHTAPVYFHWLGCGVSPNATRLECLSLDTAYLMGGVPRSHAKRYYDRVTAYLCATCAELGAL